MADMRRMNAELMRTPGDGEKADERHVAANMLDPVARHGALAAGQNRACEAVGGDAVNRRVDHALRGGGNAADPREIFLAESVYLHLPLNVRLRVGQLGEEHDARRLRVEPVNGVRAAVQIALYAPLERVHAARGGGRGVNLQGRGFAHGQQRVVLVENGDVAGRGEIPRPVVFRQRDAERSARADALVGEKRRAVHRQAQPLGIPRLPGGKRKRPAQKLIEGQRAVGFGCDVRKEHYRTLLRKSCVRGFCGWSNT